jgi:hypothetical protein
MASTLYDERTSYAARDEDAPRYRSLAEHIFIWVAWALAAAFWGATMTTMVEILRTLTQSTPAVVGGVDFGGAGYLVMDVIGALVLLGGALAYASWMYARRDRRLDPVREAATAELYDAIERQGGEDMTSRSPDRGASERDFR